MKGYIVILVFLFSYYSFSQVKYKVEYSTNPRILNAGTTFGNYGQDLSLLNQQQESVSIYNVRVFNLDNSTYAENKVVSLNNIATSFRSRFDLSLYPQGSECDGIFEETFAFSGSDCFFFTLPSISATCFTPGVDYFRVYELKSLQELNNYSVTNNKFKDCEDNQLILNSLFGFCQNQGLFGLDYRVEGKTNWTNILPYGNNPNAIDINYNQLKLLTPLIELGDIVSFRLQYTDSGIIEYSNSIEYSFIACSPELQNTTTTNTTCNNSVDGSVTLTFDRNVEAGYEMRYFVRQGTPPANPSQVVLESNNPFPAQSYADPLGIPLVNDGNGNFSGTFEGLEGNFTDINGVTTDFSNYYIIYQEVRYNFPNVGDVDIKSGEITPQFTISQPSQVTLNTTTPNFFTDANCGNPAIFQLNNTASGGNNLDANGTYGYEYSLTNGNDWVEVPNTNILEIPATTNPQSVVLRGIYNLNNSLISCKGEEYTFPISATVNPIVITNPVSVNVSRVLADDGSVEIDFSGTGTSFTYLLSRLNTATNTYEEITGTTPNVSIIPGARAVRFSGLVSGTYRITVTDASGCPQTSPDLIVGTEPVPTLGTPIVTQISCTGTAGRISIPVAGFDTSYKYQWSINGVLGAITTSSLDNLELNNISVGATYSLRVSNARVSNPDFEVDAYVAMETIVMADPTAATIENFTPNNTNCNGGNDGSITLVLSGGTTYEYALGNTPTDWFPLINSTITGLASGSYAVTVRNQNNCESQTETNIIIEEPNAILIEEVANSRQDVTVNGGNDGAITISVTDGTPPYTFMWSGPNGFIANEQNPTGLRTGNYTLLVADANNCAQNFGPIFINEPGPLGIVSLTATQVGCRAAATGSITAVVNGIAPFTYVWSSTGDASFTAPNQATITGVPAGTYTLSVTDASGDPAVTSSVEINEPLEFLVATATPIGTSCASLNDGAITIVTTGGTAPYRYSINGSGTQNSAVFDNLSAGTYAITVFDANNCSFVLNTLNVFSATAVAISTDLVLNVSESGESDGAISTSISGGTLPYTFSWAGPNGFTANTKDITNLAEGIHILTVTDANNCTATQSFNITEPAELTVTASQSLFLDCTNDNFAEIIANVAGGVPNYSYQWFQIVNGNTINLNENSAILANLSVGTYFVIVTDANNVSRTSTTITVTEPDALQVTLSSKIDVLCSGETTGSITTQITGGTAPYRFFWNNIETSSQNAINLASGDYFLEVVDANGCSENLLVTINAPANPLIIEDARVTNLSDYQTMDGSINVVINGGAPNYRLEWIRLSDNLSFSNQATITNLSAGNYQLVVTDANNCTIIQNYEVTQPDIIEETVTNPTCAGLADGSISLLVNRGNGNFSYSWNTGATTNTIANLAAGTYSVVITGFDNPETRTYTIEEPLPILVDLGGDRVLCKGQSLVLDATVANSNAIYTWTSDTGFTSTNPIVTLSEKGNYTIAISSNGNCTETSSIFVDVIDQEISAEFAASSQIYVGEILIMVDISFPIPESMEWIIPNEAQIIKQNKDEAEIVFDTPGEYEIGIITQLGSCTEIQTKTVIVLAKDPTIVEEDTKGGKKLIEDFLIYPNPTSGQFTAQVNLTDRGAISIKVFSFTNNMLIASEKARGELSYTIPFNISNMPAGVYAVVLETPYGSTLRKIMVR